MTDADDSTDQGDIESKLMTEEFFGACPVRFRGGRLRSIGRDHWFYCKQHKVKWRAVSNLFRIHTQPMTAGEVATTARYVEGFVEVAPYLPRANRDG